MKIKYLGISLLLCFGFICTLVQYQIKTTNTYSETLYIEKDPHLAQTYVDHPPIEILSDAAFSGYSFPGNGSFNNPYIIEGYNITALGSLSIAIEIRNTNSYFIIRNCLIYTEYIGIGLSYIHSGTSKISQNIIRSIMNLGGAITLRHMNNCTIERNFCHDFTQGIHIDDVDGCTIHSNTILNSGYQGINFRYSDSNIITSNIIINTKQHGIAMVGTSMNNIIHHNRLENNAWSDSYDIDGGPPQGRPTSQAYDEGSHNIWYQSETQEGNFWSDYFGVGTYSIDGPAGAVDLYPFHTTGITPFLLIIIIIPSSIAISAFLLLFLRKKRRDKHYLL